MIYVEANDWNRCGWERFRVFKYVLKKCLLILTTSKYREENQNMLLIAVFKKAPPWLIRMLVDSGGNPNQVDIDVS